MKRTIHGNSEKIYDLFFIIKFLKNILLFKQKLQKCAIGFMAYI